MSPKSKEMEAFESLERLLDAVNVEFTALQGAVKRNEEAIDKLARAIQGEDPLGGGSLAVTLNDIRGSAEKAREDLVVLEVRVEELEKEAKEDGRERRRGAIQLIACVVSALTAVACAGLALLKR